MKCESMDLEGYYMVCNQDKGVFKKGAMYPIHHNDNDFVVYDNDESRKLAKKERELDDIELMYGFYEFVPVEQFEDGTFILKKK